MADRGPLQTLRPARFAALEVLLRGFRGMMLSLRKIEKGLMSSTNATALVAELERVLANLAAELAAKGVRSVSLVGSRARGTAKPESDIDLLLDLAPDATFGLIDLVQLKDTLGDALGRKVDIAFKGGLRSYVEAHMTRDARQVLAFAAVADRG